MKTHSLRATAALLLAVFLLNIPALVTAQSRPPVADSKVFFPLMTTACGAVELLDDGGFEAGVPNPAWQVSSNVFSDILDDSPLPPPRGGTWKAWMGGDNLVRESLWQALNVPPDAGALLVSFWWRVDTFEPTHPFDSLQVQIRDQAGNPIQVLETLSDGDAAPVWRYSRFVVDGYAGQAIELAFLADTDATAPTSFFIDDVSVLAPCGR